MLDSATLAVQVPGKGATVQEILRLLEAGVIVPETIAIREPTLDDVFLQLTGHRAGTGRDQPAPQPAGPAGVNQGSSV